MATVTIWRAQPRLTHASAGWLPDANSYFRDGTLRLLTRTAGSACVSVDIPDWELR